jgi:hypothetical protein
MSWFKNFTCVDNSYIFCYDVVNSGRSLPKFRSYALFPSSVSETNVSNQQGLGSKFVGWNRPSKPRVQNLEKKTWTQRNIVGCAWRRETRNVGKHSELRSKPIVGFSKDYLLTELRPSWGAANCATTQELTSISWNQKVQYRVHKSPPLVPILSHINPIHTIPSYHSKIFFNIVHLSTSCSSQWTLSYPICMPLLHHSF